jgi:hypothetical protein
MSKLLLYTDIIRVEVLRNKNVCNFGPPLPCPPVFDDPEELRSFLKLKC